MVFILVLSVQGPWEQKTITFLDFHRMFVNYKHLGKAERETFSGPCLQPPAVKPIGGEKSAANSLRSTSEFLTNVPLRGRSLREQWSSSL